MQSTSAPLPARPKSRRRWYILGGFVLLLFATPVIVYFVAGWWSDRQMEAIYAEIDADDPHWKWADLAAEMQPRPGEENSADQVAKVRGLLRIKALSFTPAWDGDANQKSLTYRNSRLNGEQIQMLRSALGGLQTDALIEVRKLKDMPDGRFGIDTAGNPFFVKMDHIQDAREVMRLLGADAMQRAQDKDYDGAVESCQALLNTARSLKGNPTLIGFLVRIAGHAMSIGAVERTLGQGEASEDTLKKLQELLETEAADDGLWQGMRGERAIGQHFYERVREQKSALSEIVGGMGGGKRAPDERILDFFPGIILSGYPEYLRMMTEQVKAAKLKDAERASKFEELNEKVRQRVGKWPGNVLVRFMMPASQKIAEADQRSQAMLRTSAVAVAAERYRLQHDGIWPRAMDELVHQGLIKEVYTDPYDGKPLRWKNTATKGLLIYSVGPDKIDNGGKLDRNNSRAVGSDIGFELWHPSLRHVAPPVFEELAN